MFFEKNCQVSERALTLRADELVRRIFDGSVIGLGLEVGRIFLKERCSGCFRLERGLEVALNCS